MTAERWARIKEEPRQARVVEMRYFDGMTVEAIAPRTVKREWAMAKAWLRVQASSKGLP